jgi:predicted AlkP superfamily phosphohydrolase/phosphomutase
MTRLAIIGIDGATYDIIRPLVAAGELPHIARILREGVSADLESEKPPLTPPAWTSMFTGLNPGKHGVFHFIRRQLGRYDCVLNDSRNYAGKDLMSLFSARGWTVGSLAVPMTYPPFPVRGGYMVSGIPMPMEGDTIAWPRGTTQELARVLGHDYRPDVNYAPYEGDVEHARDDLERYARLRDELFAIERDRLRLMEHLLEQRPTDFFFTVVSITDRCQHYFWKFQDRSHRGFTEEGQARFGEVVRDAYRLADEFVGRARTIIGEEVPVALVSDHGFGPQHSDFHVNKWLEDTGLLVRRKVPYWTWGSMPLGAVCARLRLGWLAKLLGPLARIPLRKPKRKTRADARDIVWSKTRAFALMHGLCVNLKGREPQGIVDGPEEYRRTVAEIRALLAELRFPDGNHAVDYSLVKEEIYRGPRLQEAADIQFQMAGLSCIPKETWDARELFLFRKNAPVSGQHRFNGVFALAAPGVAPGRVIEGMHIQDTAPTLLHCVGELVPRWMDGAIRGDAMSRPEEPAWDVAEEPSAVGSVAEAFSAAEKRAIEESLRSLGYLQ